MYKPNPIDTANIALPTDLLELTEEIAENVHENWAAARVARLQRKSNGGVVDLLQSAIQLQVGNGPSGFPEGPSVYRLRKMMEAMPVRIARNFSTVSFSLKKVQETIATSTPMPPLTMG